MVRKRRGWRHGCGCCVPRPKRSEKLTNSIIDRNRSDEIETRGYVAGALRRRHRHTPSTRPTRITTASVRTTAGHGIGSHRAHRAANAAAAIFTQRSHRIALSPDATSFSSVGLCRCRVWSMTP